MQGLFLGIFLVVGGLLAYSDYKDHGLMSVVFTLISLFGLSWALISLADLAEKL